MKKILIALAIILSVQVADAQVKAPAAAKKAVASAEAAAANPKKAAKVATWLKLANAYVGAYNSPAGALWLGMGLQELDLMLSEKPVSTEDVTIAGKFYQKKIYDNKNLYFNEAGMLEIIEVTKPVIEDPLEKAVAAYNKAYEVDAKKAKVKDVTAGLKSCNEKFMNDAVTAYTFGDLAKSSEYFEKAADAVAAAPVSQFDSISVYNSGFTANLAGDTAKAIKMFEKCLFHGYYYDNGDVFSKLADLYKAAGDEKKSLAMLKQGFSEFPESQGILVGLINYYIESGEDQQELFALIDKAKKNEPDNASLYYVEGNIYSQLGNEEKAIESYYKSNEVNPEYENGLIGVGILYYNKAVAIAEEASLEFDDNKYMVLVEKFEETFKSAIEPFEKAYEICKDESIKTGLIAESLKNIYYRFQDKDPKYLAGYEKYNAIVKAARGE